MLPERAVPAGYAVLIDAFGLRVHRRKVRVLEETGDFYRYFDATPHAEFLYACVRKTIEEDLPREAEFLRRYDRFRERITRTVDMPAATMDLLFRFLQQNGGRLSGGARGKEFRALTEGETAAVEEAYADQFGG